MKLASIFLVKYSKMMFELSAGTMINIIPNFDSDSNSNPDNKENKERINARIILLTRVTKP